MASTTLTDHDLHLRLPAKQPVPKRPDPCADDRPVCPACGGLECLCRPRFFPGQLLTDEDLNRLDRYIVDKNKLHNRYLHGWGVACGLEVVCDPCSDTSVVVRAGYALSPCGDDIVVCRDDSVNVCELIEKCRQQRGVVCDPPSARPPRECRDGTEPWVLAICYEETPKRGITALTGSTDSACCSSCSCGGSGSCGCKTGTKTASTAKAKKTYQPQCEPTQICEGHRFTVYPRPPQTKVQVPDRLVDGRIELLFAWMYANRAKFGPMLERLLCCVTAGLQLRESFAERDYTTGKQAHDAYVEYHDALRDFAANFAPHTCGFDARIVADTKPDREQVVNLREVKTLGPDQAKVVSGALQKLDLSLFDLIAECFCSALLPACPEPAPDNCVPLALLTVRTRDCGVVRICNWEARKLLITWRTVGYWLSWLPWDRLRATIARLCCAGEPRRTILWPLMVMIGMVLKEAGAAKPRVAAMESEEPLKKALAEKSLMAHFSAGYDRLRTGADSEAPAWASLAARLADGSALAAFAGPEAMKAAALGDLGTNLGIDKLRQDLDGVQKTLDEYKSALDGIKNLMKGR